jgi:hypothetical protein
MGTENDHRLLEEVVADLEPVILEADQFQFLFLAIPMDRRYLHVELVAARASPVEEQKTGKVALQLVQAASFMFLATI